MFGTSLTSKRVARVCKHQLSFCFDCRCVSWVFEASIFMAVCIF